VCVYISWAFRNTGDSSLSFSTQLVRKCAASGLRKGSPELGPVLGRGGGDHRASSSGRLLLSVQLSRDERNLEAPPRPLLHVILRISFFSLLLVVWLGSWLFFKKKKEISVTG